MPLVDREGFDNDLLKPNTIRPVLEPELSHLAFLVKVSLGTFSHGSPSHKSYYLEFDTGSDLTWMQCEDCKKRRHRCFPQIEPPFPNSKSTSYSPLPCERHALCYPGECVGDFCSYSLEYADDSHSHGILALETLTFDSSSTHGKETVRMVFGCGFDNVKSYDIKPDSKLAGILGMGWGALSLVNQLSQQTHGRFSYCLPTLRQAAEGSPVRLHFGSDIHAPSNLRTTPLLEYPDDMSFYATLLDISISSHKLNIPSRFFAKGGPDTGGCIFDTGAAITRLSRPAYQILKQALMQHLSEADGSLKKQGRKYEYDLCYRRSPPFKGFTHLPSITFHFQGGADFVVQPQQAFFVESKDAHSEYVCLAMIPSDEERMSCIGVQTQANHILVFDLQAKQLHFGPQNCSPSP
uniref:Peptidase A1 domain-containing protein n=1 Tax=Kalanchoe fedtschenkoi TaxID=63787 RepID=A0A7N0U3L0_KALFE